MQRCFNIVSTLVTEVVSRLCNVENATSNFVSFSTLVNVVSTLIYKVKATLIRHWNANWVDCLTLHKKGFTARISSKNVTKSAVPWRFGHIYWRNLRRKTPFFVQCKFNDHTEDIWNKATGNLNAFSRIVPCIDFSGEEKFSWTAFLSRSLITVN